MKASVFFDMGNDELTERLDELKQELFNLRFRLATGQLENHMKLHECKKDIARIKTIIRQRELARA